MRLSEWFLSAAGWMFFSAWSVAIAAVSIVAFGNDLLLFKARKAAESPEVRQPVQTR